jgi:hypothetical protein
MNNKASISLTRRKELQYRSFGALPTAIFLKSRVSPWPTCGRELPPLVGEHAHTARRRTLVAKQLEK